MWQCVCAVCAVCAEGMAIGRYYTALCEALAHQPLSSQRAVCAVARAVAEARAVRAAASEAAEGAAFGSYPT